MTTAFVRPLAATLLLACLAWAPSWSAAQSFPTKPIRIVIGQGAGVGIDVSTRMLADVIGKDQGITVLVENKPGAATMLAATSVLQSPRDGYTVLTIQSQQYNNPMMFKTVPYKNSDFVPVAPGGLVSMAIVVSKALPVENVQDLVAYSKANPEKVFYGYWGAGGSPHLMAAMFEKVAGLRMNGVGYKTPAQGTADLATGRLHLFFTSVTHAMQLQQAGHAKVLAVGSPARLPALPDVPTFAESSVLKGVPNPWWGYAVAAGTPKEATDALERIFAKAIASPRYQELLTKTASYVGPARTPNELQAFIDQQTALWTPVIADLKLQLD